MLSMIRFGGMDLDKAGWKNLRYWNILPISLWSSASATTTAS
jgi:hypothetical protein